MPGLTRPVPPSMLKNIPHITVKDIVPQEILFETFGHLVTRFGSGDYHNFTRADYLLQDGSNKLPDFDYTSFMRNLNFTIKNIINQMVEEERAHVEKLTQQLQFTMEENSKLRSINHLFD